MWSCEMLRGFRVFYGGKNIEQSSSIAHGSRGQLGQWCYKMGQRFYQNRSLLSVGLLWLANLAGGSFAVYNRCIGEQCSACHRQVRDNSPAPK